MIILVLTPAYAQETKTTAKERQRLWPTFWAMIFLHALGRREEQIEEDKQRPQKDFIYMFMNIGSTYSPLRAWQVEMSILSKCKDTPSYHLWNKITFQLRTAGWKTAALMHQLAKKNCFTRTWDSSVTAAIKTPLVSLFCSFKVYKYSQFIQP